MSEYEEFKRVFDRKLKSSEEANTKAKAECAGTGAQDYGCTWKGKALDDKIAAGIGAKDFVAIINLIERLNYLETVPPSMFVTQKLLASDWHRLVGLLRKEVGQVPKEEIKGDSGSTWGDVKGKTAQQFAVESRLKQFATALVRHVDNSSERTVKDLDEAVEGLASIIAINEKLTLSDPEVRDRLFR
jgi:hypothetical protein